MEISDLASMLASKMDVLVHRLLPNGRKDGREWKVGSLAGEPGKSLSISIRGSRAGIWKDFASGEGGDAIDLIAHVLFNGDKRQAVAWAKSWLGLDNMDPERLKQQRRQVQKRKEEAERQEIERQEKIKRIAQACFDGANKRVLCTAVDRYLLGRAIDLKNLVYNSDFLRFHSMCFCKETNSSLPAMVAAIVNDQNQFLAAHRTYLNVQKVSVTKADLAQPKKVIGSYAGGFIEISRGQTGLPLKDARPGEKVILCEGIEDGLSLLTAKPDFRVLAVVSVSNFQNIKLPENIHQVIIAVDNDEGHQAKRAVDAAITNFISQGKTVCKISSPVGKDFNDYLQHLSKEKEGYHVR